MEGAVAGVKPHSDRSPVPAGRLHRPEHRVLDLTAQLTQRATQPILNPKFQNPLRRGKKRERAMRAFRVTTTYKRIKKRQTHKTRSKTPKK
ncbi:unnamed protein product [Nesidiocoris tenuis]|uniref:Uncharacterized protein n=1 Tax=Nesidiocoris tenuis TaxID=355587 RepID=A0A6H5GK25_9HEMI|nr:unnamed protein product [Nesidiocoris tenuis]